MVLVPVYRGSQSYTVDLDVLVPKGSDSHCIGSDGTGFLRFRMQ